MQHNQVEFIPSIQGLFNIWKLINIILHINSLENPSKSFCRYRRTNSKFYKERKNTQDSQYKIKDKEQSQRADTTQPAIKPQ